MGTNGNGLTYGLRTDFHQGYASLVMAIRPPSTPPYILMLFACTHLLLAIAKFVFDASDHRGNTLFNAVCTVIPTSFLWVAGTLPMQAIRCASNVARPTDASSLFPSDELVINKSDSL